MKRRLLTAICSMLVISMLTGCSGVIHDFVNPVTEEPEPEVTTEHKYAVNGPQATESDASTEATTEETQPAEVVPENTEPFSYVGTLVAPSSFNGQKYGSSPMTSLYLALKYSALNSDSYESFIPYECLTPEEFTAKLDTLVSDMFQPMIDSGWSIDTGSEIQLDEEGKLIVDDACRDAYVSMILVMNGVIYSEDQLQAFYNGTFVPNGEVVTMNAESIRDSAISNMLNGDDSFERENASTVYINDVEYKCYVMLSTFGMDASGTATGAITYMIYTVDETDNPLTTNDFDFDAIKATKVNCLENADLTSAGYTNGDKFLYVVCYSLSNASSDMTVFTNDISLIDTNGNTVY